MPGEELLMQAALGDICSPITALINSLGGIITAIIGAITSICAFPTAVVDNLTALCGLPTAVVDNLTALCGLPTAVVDNLTALCGLPTAVVDNLTALCGLPTAMLEVPNIWLDYLFNSAVMSSCFDSFATVVWNTLCPCSVGEQCVFSLVPCSIPLPASMFGL
jgi:hypothetical protein